mgnify:CR=1 FL=1
MRILLHGSHLLHWRSLIPVACELSHRGHKIVVQTTRPDWMGMPTWQMNWRPTKVTGVNRTSLAWLAGKMGYGEEWQETALRFTLRWRDSYDAYVHTTKAIRSWGQLCPAKTWAVGYQHLPVVVRSTGRFPRQWANIPSVFLPNNPFAELHDFGWLLNWGDAWPCGFPHLDKVRIDFGSRMNAVLIQHPGGSRGIDGHAWLANICKALDFAGLRVYVCPHYIPGRGHDAASLVTALARHGFLRAHMVRHWWEVAGYCDLILTTGSSAAYEMWAVGLTNVFVMNIAGGHRHEKFGIFKDLMLDSADDLRRLLRSLPGSAQATEPLTREVMQAFRDVHGGQGAKTAADVIEGKR